MRASPSGWAWMACASNDSSHLLAEARQAMLLQRVQGDPPRCRPARRWNWPPSAARQCWAATTSASLAPGMAADLIAFDLSAPTFAGGAVHDPVAALVFCQPQNVDLAMVQGRILVEDGRLVHLTWAGWFPPTTMRRGSFWSAPEPA